MTDPPIPAYPGRGVIPWDQALKEYIDYGDSLKGESEEPGLEWYGPWDPEVDYDEGDVVGYEGSAWVAIQYCPAGKPPSPETETMWELLASRGDDGSEGPPGPPGPPGSGEGGVVSYIHDQLAPSAEWVVVHNLGMYPSVTVVDTGDTVITPDTHYDNLNQITIVFGSATSGKAYLS